MIDDILSAARECLKTPYLHQGRRPGQGLDCAGLVRYPAEKLGLITPDDDFIEYGREPVPLKMKQELESRLDPIKRLEKGCVIWFTVIRHPQHLAIYTGNGIIHAINTGPKQVVEHCINSQWTDRIAGLYRYRF